MNDKEKQIEGRNKKSVLAIILGSIITYIIFFSGLFYTEKFIIYIEKNILRNILGITPDILFGLIFSTAFLITMFVDYYFNRSKIRALLSGVISCVIIILWIIYKVLTYRWV